MEPGHIDKIALSRSLGCLLRYLRTWSNENGLLGGMIATWWSSTLETAVPHPMNQFPMIMGFLELHRGGIRGGEWLHEAAKIGRGLVESIDSEGMLKNCWADIPGKKTGSVIFAGPAWALAELYSATKEPAFLKGAQTLLDTIQRKWVCAGIDSYGVANQGFKWAEALLSCWQATGDSQFRSMARTASCRYLDQQILRGPMRGAIHQSRTDDRLITVYQGKCLAPLLRFYEEYQDRAYLDSACLLGRYVLDQEVDDGMFVNFHEPKSWLRDIIYPFVVRLDRRVFRRRCPVYKVWRQFIWQWNTNQYPSFVARSADTLRGLWKLTRYMPEIQGRVIDLTNKLMAYQLPHGGYPGSTGFSGSNEWREWQDVCSPTRWNAYTFLLLSYLAAELCPGQEIAIPSGLPAVFEVTVGRDGDQVYREDTDSVELRHAGSLVARLAKPSGESMFLAEGWSGDLSDFRGMRNLECVNERRNQSH